MDKPPAVRHQSMTWMQRLKRVFNIDIEICECCAGKVKIIACTEDSAVIERILAHLNGKASSTELAMLPLPRIGIYVVDPKKASLVVEKLKLPSVNGAVAYEEQGITLLSEDYLRELVTIAWLTWEQNQPTRTAVVAVALRGLEPWRELWDPEKNPRLGSNEGQRWEIAFRVAVAFLMAHEVAHVEMREADKTKVRQQVFFNDPRDLDLLWMCPELVSPRYSHHQRIEQEADERAFRL